MDGGGLADVLAQQADGLADGSRLRGVGRLAPLPDCLRAAG